MKLTFGEKIKNLREDLDLNQTELGKKINMTQRKISYIECNKSEPSMDDIITFSKFFNVTSDYLLGIDENLTRNKK